MDQAFSHSPALVRDSIESSLRTAPRPGRKGLDTEPGPARSGVGVDAMRIAVLESDAAQGDVLVRCLAAAGHRCHQFQRGWDLLRAMTRDSFDLLVVEWELPDLSGDAILAWLRTKIRDDVPVLLTSARDCEQEIVAALKSGADDYLVKPLHGDELLARVEALGRRARPALRSRARLRTGEYEIDLDRRVVLRAGHPIRLTRIDFDLAVFLFRSVGRLVSRGHILEAVWGLRPDLNTRAVDTHVCRLRAKLGLVPENGWRITSVYQQGYRLEPVAVAPPPARRPGANREAS